MSYILSRRLYNLIPIQKEKGPTRRALCHSVTGSYLMHTFGVSSSSSIVHSPCKKREASNTSAVEQQDTASQPSHIKTLLPRIRAAIRTVSEAVSTSSLKTISSKPHTIF